jgi:hypothetical protein
MSDIPYGYDEVMKTINSKEPDFHSHLDDVNGTMIGIKCQCGKYVRMSAGSIMELIMEKMPSEDFDDFVRQFG